MENTQLIQQLVQLEKLTPNDIELGNLLRQFIRNNFNQDFTKQPTEKIILNDEQRN